MSPKDDHTDPNDRPQLGLFEEQATSAKKRVSNSYAIKLMARAIVDLAETAQVPADLLVAMREVIRGKR